MERVSSMEEDHEAQIKSIKRLVKEFLVFIWDWSAFKHSGFKDRNWDVIAWDQKEGLLF
jgi:hypothetical protein